jgi:homoserine acetyltransferase
LFLFSVVTGAGQTYQWITQYPSFVDQAVPFCGSAKTSLHNQVFLEGVKSALLAGKGSASAGVGMGEELRGEGEYCGWSEDQRDKGLRALGRVYAGWGLSQAFYRQRMYETHLGYESLEKFMVGFWEDWALSKGEIGMGYLYLWHSQEGDAGTYSLLMPLYRPG